jgi:hypothetical protein
VLVVELVPVVDERLELDLGMDRFAAGLGDLRPAQRGALLHRWTEEATGGVQQAGVPLEPAWNDETDDWRKLPTLIQPRVEPLGRLDPRFQAEGGWRREGAHVGMLPTRTRQVVFDAKCVTRLRSRSTHKER